MYGGGRETQHRLLHVSHLILLLSRHSQPSPKSTSSLGRVVGGVGVGRARYGKIKHREREEDGNNSAFMLEC